MAKTIVITDEQIKALTEAAEGQLGALDGVDRIYLAPKFQSAFMKVFVEVLKASATGGTQQTVDAYTKAESDGRYLGKTAKAESAKAADTATKAVSDGAGQNIATTYAKKTDLNAYVTSAQLTEILKKYQPISPAA